MKSNKFYIHIAVLSTLLLKPLAISAHPGRTDSNGCHTCWTNCDKWGLSYGEYHCHNGGKKPNYNNSQVQTHDNSNYSIHENNNHTSDKKIEDVKLSVEFDGEYFELWNSYTITYQNIEPEYFTKNINEILKYSSEYSDVFVGVNLPTVFYNGENIINFTLYNETGSDTRTLYVNVKRNDEIVEDIHTNQQSTLQDVRLQIFINDNFFFLNDTFKTSLVGQGLDEFSYRVNEDNVSVNVAKPEELKLGENIITFTLSRGSEVQTRKLYLNYKEYEQNDVALINQKNTTNEENTEQKNNANDKDVNDDLIEYDNSIDSSDHDDSVDYNNSSDFDGSTFLLNCALILGLGYIVVRIFKNE